jgi:hypothetical protein
MFAALFSFSYGLLIFALVGEAETEWLRITGIVFGVWMVLAGAIAGMQSFRR